MTSHFRAARVLGAAALSVLASYGCTLNNQKAARPTVCPVCSPGTTASAAPGQPPPPTVDEARSFFVQIDADLRKLLVRRDKMAWVNATYITDDTEKLSAMEADIALEYVTKAIAASRRYDSLDLPPDLLRMKLLLRLPGSDLVNALASPDDPKKRAELTDIVSSMQAMYGKGKYCPPKLKGKCLEVGDIGKIFKESQNEAELKDAWVGWHAIGAPMRDKYARFVELANEGARDIGYKDLGDGWRSGYDMSAEAFEADIERLWQQVKPLYEDLHCYVRGKLRKKYGEGVIAKHAPIPAHLLGNIWAQEWTDIYPMVEPYPGQSSLDVTAGLKKQKYDEKKLVALGEKFFTSLGMDPLPKSFWERSQFKKPADRDVVCHASAWDPEYNDDLRIKMCIKVNEEDLITVHHELGHDYYFHAYHSLPMLFQQGANDGFHEGIGDTLALSVTPTYLKNIGILESVPSNDKAQLDVQFKMALEKVAFLPFGLLIDKWRWDVFSGKTPKDKYNAAWWELRNKYQGVDSPVPRTEADFDPGAKFHVPGNTPYMRYFLARIYQFQFHRALCKAAGNTGPLASCSIYGNKAAGDKLEAMLALGASRPWPEAMAAIGEEPKADAGALLEYFAPLAAWLKEQNKSETCGWDGEDTSGAPLVSTAPVTTTTSPGPATSASAATVTSAAPVTSSAPLALAPAQGCPTGTDTQGAPPPKGREQFCTKKDASGNTVKHGPYTAWGPGGKPEIQGAYAEDRKTGHWVLFDGNGNKDSEGDFVDGKRDGVWINYQAGKKVSEKTYRNGEAMPLHGFPGILHERARRAEMSVSVNVTYVVSFLALSLPLGVLSCSSHDSSTEGTPFDAGPPFEGGGPCDAVVAQHPEEGFQHVDVCSAVTYATSPPSSGNHYPVWAAYRVYDIAIPHGFTVHDLEHGAIVVSYNCPSGCADEVARITAWYASLPADPACTGQGPNRVVVTPDPTLQSPFAAAAWTYTMTTTCFDEGTFTKFYEDHLGNGREVICGGGEDLEATVGALPSTCGN